MGKATKRAVGAIPAGSGCSRETVLPTAALPVAVGFSFPPLRCSLLSTAFSSSPSLGRLSALPAAMGGFLSLLTQRSVSARRGDERNQYLKMRRQSEAEVPDG